MKEVSETMPALRKYQQSNPEGYVNWINALREMEGRPDEPEESYWAMLESDLGSL